MSGMQRKPALYVAHECARMVELEGAPLASFWSRAIAFLIDFAIAAVSFVAFGIGAALIAVKAGWVTGDVQIHFEPFHHEQWASLIYYAVFIAASNYIGNGATIGKRIMKIRAVSLVHRRLSLWHSIERALGYGASALEAFFGFFQYFTHPSRRTVHDRIAETIVITERPAGSAK